MLERAGRAGQLVVHICRKSTCQLYQGLRGNRPAERAARVMPAVQHDLEKSSIPHGHHLHESMARTNNTLQCLRIGRVRDRMQAPFDGSCHRLSARAYGVTHPGCSALRVSSDPAHAVTSSPSTGCEPVGLCDQCQRPLEFPEEFTALQRCTKQRLRAVLVDRQSTRRVDPFHPAVLDKCIADIG